MFLIMRTLLTVILVLGLVELGVPQDIYPIKKPIGFGSIGESELFVPKHGKNFDGQEELPSQEPPDPLIGDSRTSENEKKDDSKSSVESTKLESIQSKTLNSNTGLLFKKNEEQNSEGTVGQLSRSNESSQKETLSLNSGGLSNKNEKQKDDHKKNDKLTDKSNECPLTTVDCLCFEGKVMEHVIHVNLKTISEVDPRTRHRKCFADEDPVAACEARNCVIIPNKNFDVLFQKGKKAHPSKNSDNVGEMDTPLANPEKNDSKQASGSVVMDSLLSAFYPVEYTYPRGKGEGGNARVARSPYGSNLCRVPSLANSEVTCWKWPNWQTCKQTCIYGHGLDNLGKTIKEKSFNCRNTENHWKPQAIRDCEPYLNCKVHLKSPGDLNCVEPTDGPAYCDINCADYDDYVGHGKVRWKCEEKPHGTKQNHLPHCAEFEEAELRLGPPQ